MFPMDKFFIYVPEIRGEQILKNKKSFLAGSIAWVSYFVNNFRAEAYQYLKTNWLILMLLSDVIFSLERIIL